MTAVSAKYSDSRILSFPTISRRGGIGYSFSRAACEHENEYPVTEPRVLRPLQDKIRESRPPRELQC
jgi:hypothetical protein